MASYIARTGVFHDAAQTKRTLMALNNQRELSQFCDVVLMVSGSQIFAHSNVLAAASPYFESFLDMGGEDGPRNFSPKQPQIIEIQIDIKEEDTDNSYGDAVRKVVDFMYTGHVTLTPTLIFQVMAIAKIMQMHKLLEFCDYFQSGEDSNIPRDTATCTTGLQEIADLLGARTKTVKHVTIATETEEVMFKKVISHSVKPEVVLSFTDHVTNHNNSLIVEEKNEFVPYSVSACDPTNEQPETLETSDSQVVGFDTHSIDHTSDAALLLSVQSLQPTLGAKSSELNITQYKQGECSPRLSESYTSVENFLSNVISSETAHVSTNSFNDTGIASQVDSLLTVTGPESHDQIHTVKERDFNIEDISDLLTFDSASPGLYKSSVVRGRGRGRPPLTRGRGRGRGRGKKRGPGRPRKVVQEDPDSDRDFEAMINHVDKGNATLPLESEDDGNTAMTDCKKSPLINEIVAKKQFGFLSRDGTEGGSFNSFLIWRSRRKRLKPLKLKRDYVVHSLTKKSRKSQNTIKAEESSSASPVDDKLNNPEATVTRVQFLCQKCEFGTRHFKEYRRHLKMHPETDPRYFFCEKCQFKTSKAREFKAHKQNHMQEELICSFCSHQSHSLNEFYEHSQKHAGESPFFCTECDSRFKTKTQLIAHKPKHQLEKPFICAICGSGFKWKHALKNHMITHSTTKDQLCDICGYATAHKSQLKAHRLIHTGLTFKCPIIGCNFEATKRQNLKYHMVTHTHEKPHQCEVCGQSFSLIKNMRRHMLLHTDKRPFSCKMCSFSTTRYDKLKEHNVKLHNFGEPKKESLDVKECEVETMSLLGVRECDIDSVRLLDSTITYVSPEGITINADGTISAEALQTIAQLASAQNLGGASLQGTTINIEQMTEDGAVYPIATVQSYTDETGRIEYMEEVTD